MWSLLPDLEDFPCDFRALRAQAAATESAALTPLLAAAHTSAPRQTDILAERLVLAARAAAPAGFSEFLATWRLSGEEGRTLLALAEALLRIPDTAVADRLINDLLARGDWTPALAEASLRVKAAGWGLALGSRFIREEDLPGRWHRLLLKAGDAVLRPALAAGIRLLAEQFVMGETLPAALARRAPGLRYSFDCLGEAAQTQAEAERYAEAYLGAIRALAGQGEQLPLPARDGLSIKLSALHPRYEARQWPRLRDELLPRLVALLEEAAVAGIPVTLDAEESERLELQLAVFAALRQVPALRRWGGLGLAVQAYQKRAPAVLDWLAGEAARHGGPIPVRLVKGAYWDSEIKRAQLTGVAHYPVWTRKRHTDIAWQACARRLLAEPRAFWPQFATHNARSLAWLETTAASLGADYEVQRLAGMGEAVHDAFRGQCQRPLRIYAPVGAFHTLLPYLVRRLLENGSSQSFVNRLADPDTPLPELIGDPVHGLGADGVQPHPSLPEPQALYPDRPGSPGLDLADPQALLALRDYCRQLPATPLAARPLVAAQAKAHRDSRPCPAPANPARVLGTLTEASQADLALAAEQAAAAFPGWAARPVQERAELLYDWADALLEAREELIALLVHEGGKTLGDAVAEWREAFDFCHYYASAAEGLLGQPVALPSVSGESNQLLLAPRGVFLCISPWNFPLAIFVGQVAAALATGNTVLAKPASQTALVAWRAVQLALRAGIPPGVLQFIPAGGRAISEVLLPHPALAGIAFTGSEPVAIELSRRLAARGGARLPLIAETGGLNALIADSSALPEQVVSDVLVSAFGSAGQRCSALRVLFVQDDIRGAVLERLKGALAEWRVDDPARLGTDAGPVIDAAARQSLEAVIERWQPQARWMASADAPPGPGHFVAPHAFWLARDDLPREEIFGPVLAIASFRHDELPAVVEWINRSGYGLTLGVHSRLDSTRDYVRRHARVGNLYENRHQTGAVVGCQPFGGEGRSGTGFKAGGPHYLLRFLTERTLTSNLSALGINTSLLDLGD